MKKGNLFTTIVFIFSIMLLIVSGAIFVYSAQQQSVSSSLQVTFSGENVDYEVQGWYQVKNSGSRTPLRDPTNDNNNTNTTISFDATEPSSTKTLAVVESEGVVSLSATNTYALFTYKFTNTASSGAFGMEVTLTNSASADSNMIVTYLTSGSDYTVTSAGVNEQAGLVTSSSAPISVFIGAGETKYFYILVSLEDPTLNGTYNKSLSPLSWNVTCSDSVTAPQPFNISDTTLTGLTAYGATLSSITIPSDVTIISDRAFEGCMSLTSVTIPASVVSIGEGAFSGCSALTEITLSGNNKQFDANAFFGCTSLIKVDCSSIQQYLTYTYETADSNPLIYAGNLYAGGTLVNSISTSSAIKDYAFCGCTSITSLAISSVTSIGNMAFYFCSGLSGTITLTSVATMGNSCFMGCSGITGVVIGDSLAVVSSYAFDNCTSLESVSIGTGLTNINSFAFAFTSALASFTVNCSSGPTVSSEAFFQSHINAITSHPNY